MGEASRESRCELGGIAEQNHDMGGGLVCGISERERRRTPLCRAGFLDDIALDCDRFLLRLIERTDSLLGVSRSEDIVLRSSSGEPFTVGQNCDNQRK